MRLCAELCSLTARMLIQELESGQSQDQHCIDELCKVFEGAAAAAKRSRRDSSKDDIFPSAELDWFSRNSYNVALKMCTVWKAGATLRIVQVCSVFIGLYPVEDNAEQASDLSLRRLFCDFLGCCLLTTLARGEEMIEDQLRYYLRLRKTMDDFRILVKRQLPKLEGGAKSDLMRKYSCLVALDFEAAARLKAWASLEDLISESESCGDDNIYSIMADIILASEAPAATIIATLQQIVSRVWPRDIGNIERLARWIRCLLSLALSFNVEMAENLMDQIFSIARSAQEKRIPYPMEELEWVATTAFNRAVDFYCTSQDAICRRWAEKAMSLADLSDDDGRLHRLLQAKYLGLTWDR
ncbi:sporulation-specific protein 22 [Xanthoria calcicola]